MKTTIPIKRKNHEYINDKEETSTETQINTYIDRLDKAKDIMTSTAHVCSSERVKEDLSIMKYFKQPNVLKKHDNLCEETLKREETRQTFKSYLTKQPCAFENTSENSSSSERVTEDLSIMKYFKQSNVLKKHENLFEDTLKREETRQTYKSYHTKQQCASKTTSQSNADTDEEHEISNTVMKIKQRLDLIDAKNVYVTASPKYEITGTNHYEINENKSLEVILNHNKTCQTSIIEGNIKDHKDENRNQFEGTPSVNIRLKTTNSIKEIESKVDEVESYIKLARNEFLNSLEVAERLLNARSSDQSQHANNLLIEIKAVKSMVMTIESLTKTNNQRKGHLFSGENLEKLNILSQMSDPVYLNTFGQRDDNNKFANTNNTTKSSFENKLKETQTHYHVESETNVDDEKIETEPNLEIEEDAMNSRNMYAKRKLVRYNLRRFVTKKSNVDYILTRKMQIVQSKQLIAKITGQTWLHLRKQISRNMDKLKEHKVNSHHVCRENIISDESSKNNFESNEKDVEITVAQNSLSVGDLDDAELILLGIYDVLITAKNLPIVQAFLRNIRTAKSSKKISKFKPKRKPQPKIDLTVTNKDVANKCTERAMRAIEDAERLLLRAYLIWPIEQTKSILEKVKDAKTLKNNREETLTDSTGKILLNSMSINYDEAKKCMHKTRKAFSTGNLKKAERLLKRANRMCPSENMKKLWKPSKEPNFDKNATEDTSSEIISKYEGVFNMDDIRKSLAVALDAFSIDNFEKAERILIDTENKWPNLGFKSLLTEIIHIKSSKVISNNEHKYDETLKESNKEEADKCIKKAENAFLDGNADKVERMLFKADRMYPGSNAKVIMALIRVVTALDKTTTKKNPTSDNVGNEEPLENKRTKEQPETPSCAVDEKDLEILGTSKNPILRWTRLLHLDKPEKDHEAAKTLMDLDTRIHVVMELYDTERNYVEALESLVKNYLQPLKGPACMGLLDPAAVDEIFKLVPAILSVHRGFLRRIRMRMERWHPQQIVGDVISEVFTQPIVTIIYTSFISNLQKSKYIIKTSAASRPAFAKFLKATARLDKGRMTLDDLLIKLVQKIPGYKLLLQRLIKYTDASHPDYSLLLEAQQEIHVLLQAINTEDS